MIKKILLGLCAVVALVLIVAALQPSDFKVERSTTVNAPIAVVFDQVNDFHRWASWSPWEKLDPSMKKTFSGSPIGPGSRYAWEGNSEVGSGAMTIVESHPPSAVVIKLEFLKPFEATNTTTFTFTQQGSQTQVNWAMTGQNGLISKVFCLFMSMDKMVGKDFEAGLAALKTVSESTPK